MPYLTKEDFLTIFKINQRIQVLNSGIIILILPTITIFFLFLFTLLKIIKSTNVAFIIYYIIFPLFICIIIILFICKIRTQKTKERLLDTIKKRTFLADEIQAKTYKLERIGLIGIEGRDEYEKEQE